MRASDVETAVLGIILVAAVGIMTGIGVVLWGFVESISEILTVLSG